MLQRRKIVLIVGGGIAAYKAADLASKLKKTGALVRVAMTSGAKKFVTPLTFEAITGEPVYHEVFNQADSYRMEHIEWARWADAIIVAPATADLIAKLTHGIADDAALTLHLAFRGPLWIAPAMNTVMWEHAATRDNLEILKRRGVHIIGPGAGPLACGEVGEGRMSEPAECIAALDEYFGGPIARPLAGKTVLITTGPTREPLDPIRFISNRSTGKMGVSLAEAARDLGANVVLIHGPLSVSAPADVQSVAADSSLEMLAAVQQHLPQCDYAVFCAAVANYRSESISDQKLKGGAELKLELVRTPDIAAWAGANRKPNQVMIGFAAESQNLLEAAKKKLADKKMDWIVANQIGVPGVAFTADDNEVTLLNSTGPVASSGKHPKSQIASWIWNEILTKR